MRVVKRSLQRSKQRKGLDHLEWVFLVVLHILHLHLDHLEVRRCRYLDIHQHSFHLPSLLSLSDALFSEPPEDLRPILSLYLSGLDLGHWKKSAVVSDTENI